MKSLRLAAGALFLVAIALRWLAPEEWTWAEPASIVFFLVAMVGLIAGDLKDRRDRRTATE